MNKLIARNFRATLNFVFCLAVLPLVVTAGSNAARADAAHEEVDLAAIDKVAAGKFKSLGMTVSEGIYEHEGRQDWKLSYEFVQGDKAMPVVVLLNGFIWPRENSAPMMYELARLAEKGKKYSVLRYDMSGQARSVSIFKEDGPAPWYMNEEMTLEKLREEATGLIASRLKAAGMPAKQKLVFLALSYGRAILPTDLSAQTDRVLELAPMIRSLDSYTPEGQQLRATIGWMAMNPFTAWTIPSFRANAWQTFYENFYQSNPGRMPNDVVPEWYIAGSAKRTDAAFDYDANEHLAAAKSILFLAENDDEPLQKDQVDYFKNSLNLKPQFPAAAYLMRGSEHGQTIQPAAIQFVVSQLDAPVKAKASFEVISSNSADADGNYDKTVKPLSVDKFFP